MNFKVFVFNPLSVNTYVVYEAISKLAVIIDPGNSDEDENREIEEFIESAGLKVLKILLTHGHFDHFWGAKYLADRFKIPILVHKEDAGLVRDGEQFAFLFAGVRIEVPDIDGYLSDGEVVEIGSGNLRVLHLPGHSPGSVAFIDEEEKNIFVGDVLFAGSIGRTDLPGSSEAQMFNSLKKLMYYRGYKVYPGHGPETSIDREIETNPFLNEPFFDK